ncbi:hypothetical protein PHO31112_03263 [Pandoraea horticolens]|uniref:Bacteriocin n=1 Tax=Pandoraea horticolens TaxID=2508298 RepID=A0A5E4WGL8_9BURK|nr:hypothetical protein PHO31112_03263 [Pandoraea horticolens]
MRTLSLDEVGRVSGAGVNVDDAITAGQIIGASVGGVGGAAIGGPIGAVGGTAVGWLAGSVIGRVIGGLGSLFD